MSVDAGKGGASGQVREQMWESRPPFREIEHAA
jgi:hypothetical protein